MDYRSSAIIAILLTGWLAGPICADQITPDRIAKLPGDQRPAWEQYLARSKKLAEQDAQVLAGELKMLGLERAAKAPDGGDFKLSHKAGDGWYTSEEAAEMARIIISYQTPSGGWSKHVKYAQGKRPAGTQWGSQYEPGKRPHYQGTFDNRSTTEQLLFLSYVTNSSVIGECRAVISKGLRYILDAQTPSGGWPQVFPLEGGYHDNITFNDDAQVHILDWLLYVRSQPKLFDYLTADERAGVEVALKRGIECILKSQIRVDGRKTAWCAQHDALTLEPDSARALEPASLSGSESAHVLQWLMKLEEPDAATIDAIESGLRWLDEVKITGLQRVKVDGKTGYVEDKDSTEVYWARFYDLKTNQPIYPGRDGQIYPSYAEMAAKNRVGYDYLSTQPGSVLNNAAKKWRKKVGR
jgi:PelA/Pel-15E family pectate lyase